jgi:hypothetical protein
MAARMAMMAITTNSSIKVNADSPVPAALLGLGFIV